MYDIGILLNGYFILGMAEGLVLSDSTLKDLPEEAKDALKNQFNLAKLHVKCYGGYSSQNLIGPAGIVETLFDQMTHIKALFLASRSNDAQDYPDGSIETRTSKLLRDYKGLILALLQRYPGLQVFALPQQRRLVATRGSQKHLENFDPIYIDSQNSIIELFQQSMIRSKKDFP